MIYYPFYYVRETGWFLRLFKLTHEVIFTYGYEYESNDTRCGGRTNLSRGLYSSLEEAEARLAELEAKPEWTKT